MPTPNWEIIRQSSKESYGSNPGDEMVSFPWPAYPNPKPARPDFVARQLV